MAVADAYLEISGTVALAACWENDHLRTADWWLAGHDPGTGASPGPPRPKPPPAIVAGGPPPSELRVEGRAFGRYAERVNGDGGEAFEDCERLVRAGRVLAAPPRWMLFRPPNVALLVLVGDEPDADDAWVATAVRQEDGQTGQLVVNSCSSRAWDEAGGLGKRARLAIAAQAAELLHWVARPGVDLRPEWAFRKAVGEHGVVLPGRLQATPPTLGDGDGDAYLEVGRVGVHVDEPRCQEARQGEGRAAAPDPAISWVAQKAIAAEMEREENAKKKAQASS
jgi:hypothetical protein